MGAERSRRQALLWLSIVAGVGLLLPLPADLRLPWLMDLAHAPVFAVWAWLACAVLARGPLGRRDACWRVAVIGGLLALASELLQLWIPGRWADWHDLLSNLFGLAAGIAVWALLPRWRPRA